MGVGVSAAVGGGREWGWVDSGGGGGNEIGALTRALARPCHGVMGLGLAGSFDFTRQ